jgi:signal transduction histidine kinase
MNSMADTGLRSEMRQELRQLERNLHDGAQQRLVALALDLKLVQARLEDDPRAAAAMLATARDELDLALEELRELARGLNPSILSERGLRAALQQLARRAPMSVRLEAPLSGRLPEQVETTAYYLVAEALTNATKHARASEAVVRLSLLPCGVRIEIRDDGVGGADIVPGGGLHGLADRLEAVGGSLEVESPQGDGTTLSAFVPLG